MAEEESRILIANDQPEGILVPDDILGGRHRGRRGMRLRTFLTRLIWLCILPLLVLAAYLALDHLRNLEAQLDLDATEAAENAATSIDRHLGAQIAALQMLAASPLVDDPTRWSDLYQEAKGFLQSFGSHVLLADRDRQMRINTRVPFGTPLPKLPNINGQAAAPMALATGMPAVSDLFMGPVAKENLVSVAVPVLRDGHAVYVLVTVIEAGQFQRRLGELALPSDWILTLLDGKGEVVARRASSSADGPGVDRERFSVKSARSPWTVVLEVPRGSASPTIRHAAVVLAIMILGATLAGVLGGKVASRRLSHSLSTLTGPLVPPVESTGIEEIEAVRDKLAEEAAARDAALMGQRSCERRFRQLFDQAPVAMGIVGKAGVTVAVNSSFTDLFGYSLADVPCLSDWWRRAYPDAEYRDRVPAAWAVSLDRTRETGVAMDAEEYRITCKDGSERIVVISKSFVEDDLLATFFDITDRKRGEAALLTSEVAMKEAQRLAGVGNWHWDARTDTATWSEEVYRAFGWDPALPAATFAEVLACFSPTSQSQLSAFVDGCLTKGVPYQCDAEAVRPDGDRRWIVVRSEAGRDAHGAIVELFGTIQDITDRKRAELALAATQAAALEAQRNGRVAALNLMEDAVVARTRTEAANAALRDSEQRLRLALDAARAGTWEWDVVSGQNRWSDEIWRLYGLVPGSCEASYETWRLSVHPDHREEVEDRVAEAVARSEEFEVEWRVLGPADVPDRWLLSRGRPVLGLDGPALRYLGIVLDVTGRRQAEEALRESEERLKLFIEHAPASLAMFDHDMRYLAVSHRWADDYHLGAQALTGRSHYEVFPDIPERWMALHRRGLAGEVLRADEDLFERVDGTTQWVRWEILPWHTQGGAIGGIVIFSEDVTERKLATEQQHRLSEALRQSGQPVVLTDTDARVLYANPAFLTLTGYSADDLVGRPVSRIAPENPAERQQQAEVIRQVLTHDRWAGELVRVARNGDAIPVYATVATIRDLSGSPVGLVANYVDLRPLKEKTRALEASEARYHSVLDNAADAVFVVTTEGRYVYVNRQAGRLLGYTEEELLELTIPDITPEEDSGHSFAMFRDLQRLGHVTTELVLKRKDGSRVPVEINAIMLPDGTAYGACRDVSDRKAAEAELAQHRDHLEKLVTARTAELQKANDQLSVTQFAMDSVGIGIHWVEVDTGRFLYVNRFAAEMLGYTVDEMLRMRVPEIDANHDDEKFARGAMDLSRQRRAAFESVQKTRNGRLIPVDVVLYYLPAVTDMPARFIAFITDISLRKATEAAREAALGEAERLAHLRREFLANMSHEIRTPLNAVLGLAQIGARESGGRKSHQTFGRILDAGQGLLAVVDDILDFSKIESGRMNLDVIPIILGNVIDRSVRTVAMRAFTKKVRFRVQEAPDLPAACLGDAKRIEQILVNLLSNAVKFTPCGGAVVLSASCRGDRLVFRVTDTGIGIAPDAVERLFQPFEQADGSTTRRFGGTGLGLSICRTLIELMGGTIAVRSAPGDGSTFEVRLPLAGAVPRGPMPVVEMALFGLPADEVATIMGALKGSYPVGSLDRVTDADAMIVVDRASLMDADVRATIEGELARNRRIAMLAAPGEDDMPHGLWDRVTVIERPLRARHLLSALSPPPQGPATAGLEHSARLAGLTILAAEDNEVNRLVLEDMLCSEGAELFSFGNGRLALDHLRQRGEDAFDLVITDIQMPEMDGYELARSVSSLTPTLPIIGLTAHAMEEERSRCIKAGMAECVVKPIDHEALVATVLRHIKPRADAPASRACTPLVDIGKLNARYGNRSEFIRRLASTVIASHRGTADELRDAAACGAMDRIGKLAHTVKGTAATLAASELQSLAARVEHAAGNSDSETTPLTELLAEAVETMLSTLRTLGGSDA